jgi:endonuclease/exonuclease/phosphatase family metal-dependent hydrolase
LPKYNFAYFSFASIFKGIRFHYPETQSTDTDQVKNKTSQKRLFLTLPILASAIFSITFPATAETIRIMAANITSGTQQSYEEPGIRIFQGLKPDIVLIQEFNYEDQGGLRELVDQAFGENYYYHVGPHTGSGDIPNGVVSKWPFKSSGWWDDIYQSNREFVWAVIDIPGEKDLQVVSVHLSSGGGATERDNQAKNLKSYVQSNFDNDHYIVIGGDLNTNNRTEDAIVTFKEFLAADVHTPVDRNYDSDTNEGRDKDYDWVMPNSLLDGYNATLPVGSRNYSNGIVFDSWVFTPLSEVAPVQWYDSHCTGMQHMAVMKAFELPEPAPTPSPLPSPTPLLINIESGDYDGDGTSDIGIFRPVAGLWSVKNITRAYFGNSADIPAPGDYNGDGTTDIGTYRTSCGLWAIRDLTRVYFGGSSDLPVSADYDGNGTSNIGLFRKASGLWAIRNITRIYFGGLQDLPVPADYSGEGTSDIALFRGSSGLWAIKNTSRIYFGGDVDIPVPGDYSGNGIAEVAIFRSYYGLWGIRETTRIYYGSSSDQPVTADYDGDFRDDAGIFRSTAGLWSVREISRVYYGTSGDIPVTR